jgi:hypothetical protein
MSEERSAAVFGFCLCRFIRVRRRGHSLRGAAALGFRFGSGLGLGLGLLNRWIGPSGCAFTGCILCSSKVGCSGFLQVLWNEGVKRLELLLRFWGRLRIGSRRRATVASLLGFTSSGGGWCRGSRSRARSLWARGSCCFGLGRSVGRFLAFRRSPLLLGLADDNLPVIVIIVGIFVLRSTGVFFCWSISYTDSLQRRSGRSGTGDHWWNVSCILRRGFLGRKGDFLSRSITRN